LQDKFPESHPSVVAAQQSVAKAEDQVKEYVELYRLFHKVTQGPKPAPETHLAVYDVHDLLDVPATQQGVLTADQQSALKDLVATMQTMVKDPNTTVSAFNGMLLVKAPDNAQHEVQAMLDQLKQSHQIHLEEMKHERSKEGLK